MNDQAESLVSLSNVAVVVAVGGRASARTLRFWASVGLEAADGSRVKLRAERRGNQYMTCPAWVRDFLTATTHLRPNADASTSV